jgi:hypothetical protein
MLEAGAGFHGMLSGRDNIHLSGAILSAHRDDFTSSSTRSYSRVERLSIRQCGTIQAVCGAPGVCDAAS